MIFVGLFFVELLLLFLLSRTLSRHISYVTHAITKSNTLTVYVLALFFLPGTVIHELSHFFMAKLLFVHAGNIRLIPQLEGKEVKLGTVAIAKTDPIRRFLIGAAPFFFGTAIILGTLYALIAFNVLENKWYLFAAGYIIFETGNTMYSSRKDMEGAFELLIITMLISAVLYFLGVRIPNIPEQTMQLLDAVFQKGAIFIGVPLIIDMLAVLLLFFIKKIL
jgi:hypothetical protein